MEHKNIFLRFLKKNNIFETYMFNFNKDRKYRMLFHRKLVNTTANCFFKTIDFQNYVCSSFEWDKTPEGECFWKKIHDKWSDDVWVLNQSYEQKNKHT